MPLQFPCPELQLAMPQVPVEHEGVPFAAVQVCVLPQFVPQVDVEFRFVSQPSFAVVLQFAKPEVQALMPHTPLVHDRVPFADEHTVLLLQLEPQVSTEFRLVSQPSFVPPQSPKPELQLLIPHTPLMHDATPLTVEQAIRVPQVVPQAVERLRSVSQPVDDTPSQFP
jgi:hypothetical protein